MSGLARLVFNQSAAGAVFAGQLHQTRSIQEASR